MENSVIQGKMPSMIKALYENVECCVNYKGVLIDFYAPAIEDRGTFRHSVNLSEILTLLTTFEQ